ncbi:hypothetical protein J3F83DRAFT_766439 [Trichoderma novae-zelandiae]
MGPFDWLAAQDEGIVVVLILVAVVVLVFGVPFVLTGTCHYVDRGARMAFKCCRLLWQDYRAAADQDVVVKTEVDNLLGQATPAGAPPPFQAPLPVYFSTDTREALARASVFTPVETPGIPPLPPVFIPAERPDLGYFEYPMASENRPVRRLATQPWKGDKYNARAHARLLSLTDGSDRLPTPAATEEGMSTASSDEDIDLSMEVEAASSSMEDSTEAFTDEDTAPFIEVKIASPMAERTEPFIMAREPSPSIHETVADSTEKTSSSDEGSPPHTNTTRATTPESELERVSRYSENAKGRPWEALASRPRTPLWKVPHKLQRVQEQSNSEAD